MTLTAKQLRALPYNSTIRARIQRANHDGAWILVSRDHSIYAVREGATDKLLGIAEDVRSLHAILGRDTKHWLA